MTEHTAVEQSIQRMREMYVRQLNECPAPDVCDEKGCVYCWHDYIQIIKELVGALELVQSNLKPLYPSDHLCVKKINQALAKEE